jgi:hypothetical protein
MAMADRLAGGLRRLIASSLLAATGALSAGAVNAAVISAGTPTTSVPAYLSDGSYLAGITVNLGASQFLLPVEIAGAANLQDWRFDLTFDNSVVRVVDPLDGTSGIYGAQFTAGDADSLSFILGGLPLNAQGLVDDVAGSYPNVFDGVTGDGVLAFILFEYLTDDQEGDDPNFGIGSPPAQPVPEPGTMLLLTAAALPLFRRQRRHCRALRAASR